MTQPDAIEALTTQLRTDLDAVHARILTELQALDDWYTHTPTVRTRRLRTLERHLLALADEADALAARTLLGITQAAYEVGAHTTALTVGTAAVFNAVDVNAVTALAQDTMADLLHATQGVRTDTKALIRELARDHVRTKLYTGQTAIQAGRDLTTALLERGVSAVTYANGARYPLPAYAQMVLRTKTAEAYQEGGFNQGERLGVEWWEVMDGPGCGWTSHDDPQTADGMIVPLNAARQYPTSHPNCVMPDTVSAFYGGAEQLVRAWYDGPSVTLRWRTPAGAHAATVGPNHPVLTGRGWVRAGLLHEGDQLVHDTRAPLPQAVLAGAEADLEQVPPSIEDRFEALRAIGTYSRVPATGDDLHGDAVFCQGDVHVVDADRHLLEVDDPSFLEQLAEGHLVGPDLLGVHEVVQRALVELVGGAPLAADGVVRGTDAPQTLLGSGGGRLQDAGLGEGAADAEVPQPLANTGSADAQSLTDDRAAQALVHVEATDLVVADGVGARLGAVSGSGCLGRLHGEGGAAPLAGGARCPSSPVLVGALESAEPLSSLGGDDRERGTAVGAGLVDGHRFLLVELERVEVGHHIGWVYDATTVGGAFTANGVVVKNCRRSTSPRPDISSARDAQEASPTPTGDATRAQEQAVVAQQRATRPVAASASAARTTTALDLQAGTLPNTRAGAHHAAVLRRHSA